MKEVDKFRAQLTEEQRSILNAIWRYYREKNQGIPAVTLHDMFGSEAAVRSALELLGGDVAYIPSFTSEKRRYHLEFLGYLLAEQGEELEGLIARYLEYVQKQLRDDGEFHEIDLQAAMEAVGFIPEQKTFFKEMFYKMPFHGSNGSRIGLPPDLEGWYYARDMRAYVQEYAMRKYDPATPIDGGRTFYIQVAAPFDDEEEETSSEDLIVGEIEISPTFG